MNPATSIVMNWSDWLLLFQHNCMLSLLSIGGAITTLPEIHRFLVEQHHWLTDTQFNISVAIAQSSPGPNVLFIALLGWNVGINAGGVATGFLGVFITMTGILVPGTTLTYWVSGWLHRNYMLRSVIAFKQGLAPIVIALIIGTGWIMASTHPPEEWHLWVVTFITALLIWRTQIHLLWFIVIGALLGWFGLV